MIDSLIFEKVKNLEVGYSDFGGISQFQIKKPIFLDYLSLNISQDNLITNPFWTAIKKEQIKVQILALFWLNKNKLDKLADLRVEKLELTLSSKAAIKDLK